MDFDKIPTRILNLKNPLEAFKDSPLLENPYDFVTFYVKLLILKAETYLKLN